MWGKINNLFAENVTVVRLLSCIRWINIGALTKNNIRVQRRSAGFHRFHFNIRVKARAAWALTLILSENTTFANDRYSRNDVTFSVLVSFSAAIFFFFFFSDRTRGRYNPPGAVVSHANTMYSWKFNENGWKLHPITRGNGRVFWVLKMLARAVNYRGSNGTMYYVQYRDQGRWMLVPAWKVKIPWNFSYLGIVHAWEISPDPFGILSSMCRFR